MSRGHSVGGAAAVVRCMGVRRCHTATAWEARQWWYGAWEQGGAALPERGRRGSGGTVHGSRAVPYCQSVGGAEAVVRCMGVGRCHTATAWEARQWWFGAWEQDGAALPRPGRPGGPAERLRRGTSSERRVCGHGVIACPAGSADCLTALRRRSIGGPPAPWPGTAPHCSEALAAPRFRWLLRVPQDPGAGRRGVMRRRRPVPGSHGPTVTENMARLPPENSM